MPDMASVPGPLPVAPLVSVAGLLAQAVQPGLAAEIAGTGDPVDSVSLSPAALLQQVLDAPGAAMQQLGSLLQEVEQIAQLTSTVAPLAMGELAAEIGTAAGELGAGVQALLPPPDEVPTPLQLATAAALRALVTLAPALRHAGGKSLDLAPAVQAWRKALPGDPAGAWPIGTSATTAAAQESLEPESAHLSQVSAPQTLPDVGDLSGRMPPKLSAPGHDASAMGLTAEGCPPADDAGPDHGALPADPGREAQVAARAILRSANDALGRMQLGMDAAAAPTAAAHPAAVINALSPGFDRSWCAAQIVLAQAQIARASRAIESQPPATPVWRRMAALLDQGSIGLAKAASRHRLLVRAGTLLALLCLATAMLWTASQLDLTLARIAAAILLALGGLAWTWRRSASWRRSRLRIELRR